MAMTKIKTQGELSEIVRKAKDQGKTIGFTNGCFDILHLGHIRYLREAKRGCDILVIGVNSDDSVKRLKGDARPLNSEKVRMEILAAMEDVDYLTLFGEDTPGDLIKKLTPHMLFKGGDWSEENIVGADHVKSHGGKVQPIPYVEDYSTTRLIEKIKRESR